MSPFRDHTYRYLSPYVSSHRNVLLLMSPYQRPCTDVSSYHCVYAYNYVTVRIKLQALVYDILPLTTAVFSYASYPSPYVSSHRNVLLLMSPYQRPCTDVSSYHCVYAYNYVIVWIKLQALVYDILLLTTAVFSYDIGSRKLSSNKQFFVGAQTVISLLQTTQIKQGVSFIAANKVYTSTNVTVICKVPVHCCFTSTETV